MLLCNIMLGKSCQYILSSLINVGSFGRPKSRKEKNKNKTHRLEGTRGQTEQKTICPTPTPPKKSSQTQDFTEESKHHSVKFNTILIFPLIKSYFCNPY